MAGGTCPGCLCSPSPCSAASNAEGSKQQVAAWRQGVKAAARCPRLRDSPVSRQQLTTGPDRPAATALHGGAQRSALPWGKGFHCKSLHFLSAPILENEVPIGRRTLIRLAILVAQAVAIATRSAVICCSSLCLGDEDSICASSAREACPVAQVVGSVARSTVICLPALSLGVKGAMCARSSRRACLAAQVVHP